jgi:peptide/nickel transport system permease protein
MAVAIEAERPTLGGLRRAFGRRSLVGRLVRRPAGFLSLAGVLAVLVVAALAPVIAPHDPNAIDVIAQFQGPSGEHLLGTDYLGRDILSRLVFGAQMAISIAFPAVAFGFVGGLVLGLVAGYLEGPVDKVVAVVSDMLLAMPAVILGLALLAVLGPSRAGTIAVIALAFLPWYTRLARSQVLAVKEQPYIKAGRALGVSRTRIISFHVLPNIIPPLLILVAMDIPAAIGIEAGLAFLGLGVQPPAADWGVMLSDGFRDVRTAIWPLVSPLVTIVVITSSFLLLGETLRDLTDPRLAGALRRRRWIHLGKVKV